jgi:hypothetical protein
MGPNWYCITPATLPFEPEPESEAELVYTHVLMDYAQDGSSDSYCELHTVQSLVEAIALRSDRDERFQVFELGRSILDVNPE